MNADKIPPIAHKAVAAAIADAVNPVGESRTSDSLNCAVDAFPIALVNSSNFAVLPSKLLKNLLKPPSNLSNVPEDTLLLIANSLREFFISGEMPSDLLIFLSNSPEVIFILSAN